MVSERIQDRLVTVAEGADVLGISIHTMRAWVAARKITAVRLGRAVRLPLASLRALIEDATVPAIADLSGRQNRTTAQVQRDRRSPRARE